MGYLFRMASITLLALALSSCMTGISIKSWPSHDRADQLVEKGLFYEAIEYYEKALQADPESFPNWTDYGVCLRKANYLQRAARAGWRAIELAPKDARPWQSIGNVFLQARDWDAASMTFRTVWELGGDTKSAGHLFEILGWEQWLSGDSVQALISLQYALKVNPSSPLAHWDIGRVLASQGDLEEGMRFIRKAIALYKNENNDTLLDAVRKNLEEIDTNKGEKIPPVDVANSFQRLPARFHVQPGRALGLEIDAHVERAFQMPDRSLWTMRTGESWKEAIRNAPSGQLPMVEFSPINSNAFKLLVSSTLSAEDISEIALSVRERGEKLLDSSVEKSLDLVEINSPTARGYLYFLTDRSIDLKRQKAGEYPYMLQGEVRSGRLKFHVTMMSLYNDKVFLEEMLQAVRSLTSI